MIKVLENDVVMCPKCKKNLEYVYSDIQFGVTEYEVYGCETTYENYKYIECPCCKHEVKIK
jgi:hypothetical protein